MPIYNVSFEISANADSPLEAAQTVSSWMEDGSSWQFFVQQENSSEVFSVDLNEEGPDRIVKVEDYCSIIQL